MDIGGQIKRIRKERGYSQEQLAEMTNSSLKDIFRWEHNQGMSIRSLTKVCKALNASVIITDNRG